MKLKDDEFQFIHTLIRKLPKCVKYEVLAEVSYKGEDYPIHSFTIGSDDPNVPVIGYFGGVHGLEKVGSHVVLSYLNYLFEQLKWNQELNRFFERAKMVCIPIVNPVGLYHNKRSNGNGVDLMRNAPIESQAKVPFLVGGQNYSSKLPWYRGNPEQMELESRVLVDFVEKHLLPAKFSLSIDFHSGFGLKDRLWYPFGASTMTFPDLGIVNKLESLLNKTMPHHIYIIEPQSNQYTTHGDLWEYLYQKNQEKYSQNKFIPWTLEMGSWIWFKKNPLQILSPHGLFNPMKGHRFARTMRRHFLMMDFFLKATENYKVWL